MVGDRRWTAYRDGELFMAYVKSLWGCGLASGGDENRFTAAFAHFGESGRDLRQGKRFCFDQGNAASAKSGRISRSAPAEALESNAKGDVSTSRGTKSSAAPNERIWMAFIPGSF